MSVTSAGNAPYQRPPRPVGTRTSRIISNGALSCMVLFADTQSLSAKFSAQSLGQIENVFDFGDVVFAGKQRAQSLEIHLGADAQLGVGFGHGVADHKTPRAHLEKTFRFML